MESALPWFAVGVAVLYTMMLVYAAYSDIRSLEVQNAVVIGIAALFVPAAALAGLDLQTVAMHLGIGLSALAVGFALFASRLMGGADGKLLAAVALWSGSDSIARLLVYVAIAGGALAIAVLVLRRLVHSPAVTKRLPWLAGARWRETPLPYCAAIAVGALLTLPHTPLMPALLADAAGY